MSPRPASELAALFSDAVVYELHGNGDAEALWPDERQLVDRAVVGRVQQFAAGRQCARAGLIELGFSPGSLLRSSGRAPAWPNAITGSISHTEGYAVAVVRRVVVDAPRSVGIDAEYVGRVTPELYRRLFTATEREWLHSLPSADRDAIATVLFGLKESFYKAQFPLTEAWVGFEDVEVLADGSEFLLHRRSDIDALDSVVWPVRGRVVIRDGLAVVGVDVAVAGTADR